MVLSGATGPGGAHPAAASATLIALQRGPRAPAWARWPSTNRRGGFRPGRVGCAVGIV